MGVMASLRLCFTLPLILVIDRAGASVERKTRASAGRSGERSAKTHAA